MANVGINADDQARIVKFKEDFSARYEGRKTDGRDEKVALVADMLKWSLEYLHKLGLDGYISIESKTVKKNVAGLIIPGAEEEVFYPVVTITGRLDKREQAYFDRGVDIERKMFDAQNDTTKQMRDKGWDTNLLQ